MYCLQRIDSQILCFMWSFSHRCQHYCHHLSNLLCLYIYYNAVPTDIGACVRRRSVASRALPILFNSASVVSSITSSVIAIITVLTVDSIFYKTVPTFVTIVSRAYRATITYVSCFYNTSRTTSITINIIPIISFFSIIPNAIPTLI